MVSPNIKELLTAFSPSSDFLAIASGDGRIKIWDTSKGHLQIDFADITSTDDTGLSTMPRNGHLSLDYTCMKWISIENKKNRKTGQSLLVLGTGSGDVLALDVAAGQLTWRACDCHAGGVNAISYSSHDPHIYTAGVDGMVCQIDSRMGNLLGKFKASTKALSSISISPDGKTLATAAGLLKIFSCPDYKKIQKFSGHPVAVRCMIFMDEGKYILSSASGERYIAVWKIDGGRKQLVSCVLSMDHPAVFLDSKGSGNGDSDFFVLAISELGICYFWHGRNVEELRTVKPTKISLSSENILPKHQKSSIPTIFAAKLHSIVKSGSAQVYVAYGSVIKPSLEKLLVQHGVDVTLMRSQDGILLPIIPTSKSKKGQMWRPEVTALDRANAEDAILPIPKLYGFNDNKRKYNLQSTFEATATDIVVDNKSEVMAMDIEEDSENVEDNAGTICMEEKLRSSGIIGNEDDLRRESYAVVPPGITLNVASQDDHLWFEVNIPVKKMKTAVLSLSPSDAFDVLRLLVTALTLRPKSEKYILPWISYILLIHGHYVISLESSTKMLDTILEMTRSKRAAIQPLLQLSGRIKLFTAQIEKAKQPPVQASSAHQVDDSEDEDDDEDIVELVYGEEELSQSGSDVDFEEDQL